MIDFVCKGFDARLLRHSIDQSLIIIVTTPMNLTYQLVYSNERGRDGVKYHFNYIVEKQSNMHEILLIFTRID